VNCTHDVCESGRRELGGPVTRRRRRVAVRGGGAISPHSVAGRDGTWRMQQLEANPLPYVCVGVGAHCNQTRIAAPLL
jgi:hypothetical protein